jgi:DNA-binding beta-propeller fold protein YncE/mono/diheme cytochrome c family protein
MTTQRPVQLLSLLCLGVIAGCNNGPAAFDGPTSSSSLLAADGKDVLYAVNEGVGTISRVDLRSGDVQEIELGDIPFRVTSPGSDTVIVSLRGERSLVVLEESGKGLSEVRRIPVGAEPTGVVGNPSTGHVFVALAAENQVWELDENLEHVDTFDVPGQPWFLSLHPDGEHLYAGSAYGGSISHVRLSDGSVTTHALPAMEGLEADHTDTAVTLTPRVTGDLAVSPDGQTVAVPVHYVDNVTPTDPDGDDVAEPEGSYSAGAGSVGLTRMNPTVVTFGVGDGEVSGDGEVFLLAGRVSSSGRSNEVVRGYPSSVTWHPDGSFMWVTFEGSNAVEALLPEARLVMTEYHEDATSEVGQMVSGDRAIFATDGGPRGVAFTADGDAYVHNFLARTVRVLGDEASASVDGAKLSELTLPAGVEEGRELFYASTGGLMSADGAGVSCATCHFNVRNDGLTWHLENGLRQTPSLAGEVSHTGPFTWTLGVDTVQDEAMHTSEVRMGGAGLTGAEADALASFVDWHPAVDVADVEDADAVARGKALFFRADVGCGSCHTGADYTDGREYDMFGLEGVNTPRLVGLAATAPYLHDGAAADLHELVGMLDGQMGDTTMLSDDEKSDLVAFLKSL